MLLSLNFIFYQWDFFVEKTRTEEGNRAFRKPFMKVKSFNYSYLIIVVSRMQFYIDEQLSWCKMES